MTQVQKMIIQSRYSINCLIKSSNHAMKNHLCDEDLYEDYNQAHEESRGVNFFNNNLSV